jgi:hypothetical protein
MSIAAHRLLQAVLALVLVAGVALTPVADVIAETTPQAAISLSSSYSQNFNGLANTGTSNVWTDDATIAGWYSTRTVYIASPGSSTTGALYSFGTTSSSERALGSVASGGTGTVRFGARFVNDTGLAVTSLTVSYTGEQWRNGGNTVQHTLSFDYLVGATVTSITAGTWTAVSALNFTGPIATATAAALDGNASANRVALSHTFNVTVPAGQEIMLRWSDPNDDGNDHGLAVDDLAVTATTAVADLPPTVSSTSPVANATGVAVDANIEITFSEPVDVAAGWYTIACATSGAHSASVTGGPTAFTLDPAPDFVQGETCTVTIDATKVTDQDSNDPPDQMEANYVWSFTVEEPVAGAVIINELDADTPGTDVAEFVELYDGGAGNTSLTGLVLVLFNGNGDLSYGAFDLDGRSTDAAGFFVLCGNAANVANCDWDVTPDQDLIQNGQDAAALYAANATDFPNGTAVTVANLLDAIVYDTDDPDDPGLLVLLNANQPQVNENGNANGAAESNQRCPNGAGGQRNTDTYLQRALTPGVANDCPADAPPQVASTSPNNGAGNVPVNSTITLTFDQRVDLAAGALIVECPTGTPVAYAPALPQLNVNTITLTPAAALPAGTVCTVTAVASLITDTYGAPQQLDGDGNGTGGDNYAFSFTTGFANVCGNPATLVSAVQGSGATSPLLGNIATIEGLVVGDFQRITGNNRLSGFFVQEEAADFDADPATSEGIFVYEGSTSLLDVAVGDQVRLTGAVTEWPDRTVGGGTLTQISALSNLQRCSSGNPVTPVAVTLPETANGDLERYEGMLVSIASPMTVAQNYFVGRYGQMTLSASGRLYQPTNQALPGSPAAATLADLNARNLLILDDGMAVDRCGDNPSPVPYLGAPPPAVLRAGDGVSSLVGVLDYGQINSGSTGPCNVGATLFAGDFRLHPVAPPVFTAVNTRPAAPAAVGGNVRVASFNVLNYFNTFGAACTLGVGGGATECRGADNATEFTRQRDKIIAAIVALNADVIGIMEMENDGYGSASAIQDLVNGLNAAAGAGTYAFVDADAALSGTNVLGTDAIKVGLLYKPARVTPLGTAALNSAAFTDPLGTGFPRSRPALAQTFEEATWGERFTVVVNHLKSKGSCPTSGVDADQGDGQGCWNATRTAGAAHLVNTWLPSDPTGSGDPDFLVMGDLNAYAREDPITAVEGAGYVNLIQSLMGSAAYSYIFDGQSGYLDHALARSSLAAQATGAAEWHINADEPAVIDYNTDFNPSGYYSPDVYRSADHDPVLVGLGLYADLSDLAAYGLAWHTGQGGWRLGTGWTGEPAGGADANDGVARNYSDSWNDGTGEVAVTVTGPAGQWACLNAWLDYSDGAVVAGTPDTPNTAFDANERVVNNLPIQASAAQQVTWPLEVGVINQAAQYNMRFRLVPAPDPNVADCSGVTDGALGGAQPTGRADGGEVEDYTFAPGPLAVTLAGFSAVQQGDAVLVTWETVSEIDNRGFNLYRGLSPASPDRQLNQHLIPSQSSGSATGFVYTWEDRADLVAGQTYYYWLEDLDVSGATTLHGPVSALFGAPTAVTLGGLSAESAPAGPGWWWVALAAWALGGLWLLRRRAARSIG